MTRREQIKSADLELKMNFSNHSFEFVSGLSEGFYRGANWADRTMLDKVCEWLKENIDLYTTEQISIKSWYPKIVLTDDFEKNFRQELGGGEE